MARKSTRVTPVIRPTVPIPRLRPNMSAQSVANQRKEMEAKLKAASLQAQAGPSREELAAAAKNLDEHDKELGEIQDVEDSESSESEPEDPQNALVPRPEFVRLPENYQFRPDRPPPGWKGSQEEWKSCVDKGNYKGGSSGLTTYPPFEEPRKNVLRKGHLDSVGSSNQDDFVVHSPNFMELSILDMGLSDVQLSQLGVLVQRIVDFSSTPGGKATSLMTETSVIVNREVAPSTSGLLVITPTVQRAPICTVRPEIPEGLRVPVLSYAGVEVKVRKTGAWEQFPMVITGGDARQVWMEEMRKKRMNVMASLKYSPDTARFYTGG